MFTCSLEAELPRQEAATHRRGIIASTGHLSRLPHPPPHKRHNCSPDLPHSLPCVAPFTRQTSSMQNGRAVRKQSSRLGLGRHDSSSTQLVLPYSSQRFGTNGRPSRRSTDTLAAIFNNWRNQRRPQIVSASRPEFGCIKGRVIIWPGHRRHYY